MSGRSLRLRFLLASAISIGLALVIAGFGLVELFGRHVERRARAELTTYIQQLAAGLTFADDGTVSLPVTLADPRFRRVFGGLYWEVREEGTPLVLRSRSLWDHVLPLPTDTLKAGVVHSHTLPGPQGSRLMVQEQEISYTTPLGTRTMRFAVALDRRDIATARAEFASEIFPALSLLGAILVIAAWIQVILGLRPLEAVRRGVNAIRSQQQRRLEGSFPDEVMPLVQEVNDLLEAQDSAIESARMRAGDLAHGLKTPLTVLAGDARRLREKGELEMAAELERLAQSMQRHIDYELVRTRAAFESRRGGLETDLAATTARLVSAMRRTPRGEALDWSLDLPDSLPVALDQRDLTEVIGNLVENAVKWARSRVAVSLKREAGTVALIVSDDGAGVPEKLIDELGQRGRRLDERVPGTGLGLAIVKEIVEAYGGQLELQNLTGGGFAAVVRLRLPHN
jgi:signal transduction histidine kinase